jgi:hypothetical protein
MNVAPAWTRVTRWGALTARQRSWAASTSLQSWPGRAVQLPGFGDLGAVRKVAKVDGVGLVLS